ncbi:MAG: hypothetical protein K0M45_05725 [Candidatus Paracaedibacteraceae bacterium]|nr:hypothetical protein [Candidatus Paracaedibacteraceae bacterium]
MGKAHLKGKAFKKSVMGAMSGAVAAESMSELLMLVYVPRIEQQLAESGLEKGSEAYSQRREVLKADAFKQIKLFSQMTAVMVAQGLGFDIHEAVNAAEMALRYNSSQVFAGILQSNNPDDLFAAMVEDQLGEGEEKTENPKPGLTKSRSFTDLQYLQEIEVVESIERSVEEDAVRKNSIGLKIFACWANAVGEVEACTPRQAHYGRYNMRRLRVDGKKLGVEGIELLKDKLEGRSIDDSRLEAYSQLFCDWLPKGTRLLSQLFAGRGGKGRIPLPRNTNRHPLPRHSEKPSKGKMIAHQNRTPVESNRSANANRIYEDMRAVANGSSANKSKGINPAWAVSSSSKGGELFMKHLGSKPPATAKQWIQKTMPAETVAYRGRGTGTTPKLGRDLLTGKMEPKGKEVVRDNRPVS